MATKIVTKNSSTASAVPTASDLVQGELAVNVADKRLFTEDNGGSIVELGTNPSSLTVSGDIDVDGTTNLDVVDIDGAVDMASTLTVGTTIATGSGGASGKIAIAGNTATSEATHITFTNGAGAKVFAVGGGQSGVTNNGFVIRNVTDNTFPLVISDASAATFAALAWI